MPLDTASTTSHVPFVATLQQVSRLNRAFEAISYDEFCEVLLATIGAQPDYASTCWPSFRQWPVGYCATRGPISQGEGLFALALAKMNHANTTGRNLHCKGEGQCHGQAHCCVTCGDVDRVCHRIESCKWHGPVSADMVMKDAIDSFNGRGVKHPMRRDDLAEGLTRRFSSHVDFTVVRANMVIDLLIDIGEIVPHALYGDEWLMRPLMTLKQGEHSVECPVTVEYWLIEPAECDPRVCAHVPIAKEDDSDVEDD
jgi:hypothetical protein